MSRSRLRTPDHAILRAAMAVSLACAALLGTTHARADAAGLTVTGIEVAAEGKLARVRILASGPIEQFIVSRQGPPEKRDLVVRLKGAGQAMPVPPTDVSGAEPLVPYEVSAAEEDGSKVLKVVFPRAGDSLVRMDHEAGALSFLLIPPESRRTVAADAYRIGADDVLAISVFGHDDLTKTTKVSPDGLINFPLIGNVRASGRSVDDVAGEIQEKLARDYLVDPHVTVSVWEYLSQWVNVIGEVSKPGRYYLTGPTTLIDAISQAGGLKPTSGDSILITRRPQESDPTTAGELLRYSTAALFGEEKAAAVVRLRSGDVVNVLAREVFYLSGEVRNPGTYTLDRTTTLTKAITLAGGANGGSAGLTAEITREEAGAQQRTTYSLREIDERKVPDPALHAGDLVVVRRRS